MISRELLHQVQTPFPCLKWSDDETGDLAKPDFGVIAGVWESLADIERPGVRDLEEIALSGTLPAPEALL